MNVCDPGSERAGLRVPQSHTLPHLSLPSPPRFLMKSYLQAQVSAGPPQKPLPPSVMYLAKPGPARCAARTAADFLCPDLYTTAWAHVSTR